MVACAIVVGIRAIFPILRAITFVVIRVTKYHAHERFLYQLHKADKVWAEWIGWILEEAGLSVIIQAWDFRPGGNFVLNMQRASSLAEKTIVVLSPSLFAIGIYPARIGGGVHPRPSR